MTDDAPDLLARLRAAGVRVSLKLRLDPTTAGDALPPALLAEASEARPALLRHLAAELPDAPPQPRPDLRGVLLCIDDAGVSPWAEGAPRPDAGPRLLSILRERWPAEVVRELTERHARDAVTLDAGAAFGRLWCGCLDVTRPRDG